jgi:hypothetical protein
MEDKLRFAIRKGGRTVSAGIVANTMSNQRIARLAVLVCLS